jgi:hypothetical protein
MLFKIMAYLRYKGFNKYFYRKARMVIKMLFNLKMIYYYRYENA